MEVGESYSYVRWGLELIQLQTIRHKLVCFNATSHVVGRVLERKSMVHEFEALMRLSPLQDFLGGYL